MPRLIEDKVNFSYDNGAVSGTDFNDDEKSYIIRIHLLYLMDAKLFPCSSLERLPKKGTCQHSREMAQKARAVQSWWP